MGFLKGKTAIITGGGRPTPLKDGSAGSIGYGIAIAYAKEGANLVLTGRNVQKLEDAKNEIEKLRSELIYQERSERVAYAHTNTFFILEEKMGRFYRDAMCASDTKIGF